jgi:hypothetical protein
MVSATAAPIPESFSVPLWARALACVAGAPAKELVDLRVNLRYDAADPFAITLDIASGTGWVRWQIDRDLVADGMNTGIGLGDVFIYPDTVAGTSRVWVCLHAPTGGQSVQLGFRRADLEHALDQIEDLVPAGTEWDRIDWAHEFAVLGGER